MLSDAKPISSASAAPAAVTAAGVSPALGTGQRPGEEGQGQREDLAGSLGLQVVAGAVDDGQFTAAGGQAGDDVLALGARIAQSGSRLPATLPRTMTCAGWK